MTPSTRGLKTAFWRRFQTSSPCTEFIWHGGVDLKNILNLNLRIMFYLVGSFRTSSPVDSISSNPEKIVMRRWKEEPGYIEVCNEEQVV